MENKFKVGDILTGKPSNGYIYTTENSVVQVIGKKGSNVLQIVILEQEDFPTEVGSAYIVESMYFKHHNKPVKVKTIKEMHTKYM